GSRRSNSDEGIRIRKPSIGFSKPAGTSLVALYCLYGTFGGGLLALVWRAAVTAHVELPHAYAHFGKAHAQGLQLLIHQPFNGVILHDHPNVHVTVFHGQMDLHASQLRGMEVNLHGSPAGLPCLVDMGAADLVLDLIGLHGRG